jgi:hypothetical protein
LIPFAGGRDAANGESPNRLALSIMKLMILIILPRGDEELKVEEVAAEKCSFCLCRGEEEPPERGDLGEDIVGEDLDVVERMESSLAAAWQNSGAKIVAMRSDEQASDKMDSSWHKWAKATNMAFSS